MNLLRAPCLYRLSLVEARKIAVVALIERNTIRRRHIRRAEFVKEKPHRPFRPQQIRREREVEADARRLEPALLSGLLDPKSVRSGSFQPVKMFFKFHSLWPWRTSTRMRSISHPCLANER